MNSILRVTGGFIEINDCANTTRANYNLFMNKEGNLDIILEILDSIDSLKGEIQSEKNKKSG